ncbi:MAG: hypothetical protein HN342_14890 [Nitrospina sp.]|nr:hypothetical protein [Nitrospina sp.]
MADLKIRVFENAGAESDTTVNIPGDFLKVARKLIQKQEKVEISLECKCLSDYLVL